MKISVVVPVYNTSKYLRKCLDSLVNQTFKDIEIICVNDGSTDSSLSILQEYKAKYNSIKIISQENQGLSSARNTGRPIKSWMKTRSLGTEISDLGANRTQLRSNAACSGEVISRNVIKNWFPWARIFSTW